MAERRQPPWYQPLSRMGLNRAKVESGIMPPAEEPHDIRLISDKERADDARKKLIADKLREVLTGRFLDKLPTGKR